MDRPLCRSQCRLRLWRRRLDRLRGFSVAERIPGWRHAGYNLQTGLWVWGIEGDLAWANIDDSVGARTSEITWFGTARGRIGYAGGAA